MQRVEGEPSTHFLSGWYILRINMNEVGKVTHYYGKIGVAIVALLIITVTYQDIARLLA